VVSQRLGIRCRSEKPGLLGRASVATSSAQDAADAATVGRAGVEALAAGETNVMVALNPVASREKTRLVPLSQAAGHERTIPAEWLQRGPIPVTQAFFDYVGPLTGPLDEHITEFGTVVRAAGVR
jgi:6-phosphofructokinase 1